MNIEYWIHPPITRVLATMSISLTPWSFFVVVPFVFVFRATSFAVAWVVGSEPSIPSERMKHKSVRSISRMWSRNALAKGGVYGVCTFVSVV